MSVSLNSLPSRANSTNSSGKLDKDQMTYGMNITKSQNYCNTISKNNSNSSSFNASNLTNRSVQNVSDNIKNKSSGNINSPRYEHQVLPEQKLRNFVGVQQSTEVRLSQKDIDNALEIGEGAFGKTVAVNGYIVKSANENDCIISLFDECNIGQQLKQKVENTIKKSKDTYNMVSSIQGFETLNVATSMIGNKDFPYLVQNRIYGPTLARTNITNQLFQRVISPQDSIKYISSAVSGLYTMSENGICHLDIKDNNIIMRNNMDGTQTPVVIDFGLSGKTGEVVAFQTRPDYMAPEMPQSISANVLASPQMDVYSYGFVFVKLLFSDQNCDDIVNKINDWLKVNPDAEHHELREYMQNWLLQYNNNRKNFHYQYNPVLLKAMANIIADCLMQNPQPAYKWDIVTTEEFLSNKNGSPRIFKIIDSEQGQFIAYEENNQLYGLPINQIQNSPYYTTEHNGKTFIVEYNKDTQQAIWLEARYVRNKDVQYDPLNPQIRPDPEDLKRLFDGIFASKYMSSCKTKVEYVKFQHPDDKTAIKVGMKSTNEKVSPKNENGDIIEGKSAVDVHEISYTLHEKLCTCKVASFSKDEKTKEDIWTILDGDRIQGCDAFKMNSDGTIDLQVSKVEYDNIDVNDDGLSAYDKFQDENCQDITVTLDHDAQTAEDDQKHTVTYTHNGHNYELNCIQLPNNEYEITDGKNERGDKITNIQGNKIFRFNPTSNTIDLKTENVFFNPQSKEDMKFANWFKQLADEVKQEKLNQPAVSRRSETGKMKAHKKPIVYNNGAIE